MAKYYMKIFKLFFKKCLNSSKSHVVPFAYLRIWLCIEAYRIQEELMRVSRLLLFFILLPGFSYSQFGNEWINYGQVYYKIPVGKNGLYKLTKSDLAQAGLPVDQVDPRRIQIFHRGIEQAIVFQHQQTPANGVFDDAEFLEFYGKKNDGTQDASLYKPASSQPHSYYNLYNDTAYYFLTVHPTMQGKRMSTFTQTNTGGLPVEASHTSEHLTLLTSTYAVGETFNNFVQLSSFGKGEGWSGAVLRENTAEDIVLTGLNNGVTTAGLPQLTVQLLGRGAVSHRAELYVGPNSGSLRLLQTTDFSGFETSTLVNTLAWTDINASGSMTVRVRIVGTGGVDFVSASYAKVSYPRNFSMTGENERTFLLQETGTGKSYVEISGAPTSARIFDITDSNNSLVIGATPTTTLNAVVDNTTTARKLFVTNQTTTPTQIKRITFRSFTTANASYVIISNKLLQRAALGSANPVRSYAAYRASAQGGGYDTLSVTVDQLYNQFSYGESTPLAIFRFIKSLEVHRRPDYLFIIGKGLDVSARYYRNPSAFTEYKDFVPSAGLPASDMFYSVGLNDPLTNEPAIPIGRLSATRPEHVIQYLNKVIEQEASSFDDLWRKRLMHLSGGIAPGEPETFKGYMESFASVAENVYLGGSVSAIAKRSLQAQELINISDQVNSGLGLITFFGHSSTSTTDFDIGFATDPVLGYNNKGKYPMLLINGCNAGAFFGNRILFGEDWINAADKGAVGFIAHSSFGLVSSLKRYSDFFYQVAYGDSTYLKRGIGDIQKEVARRYLEASLGSASNISQVHQMVLLGDPAVKLFGATLPDYEITPTSISVEASDGKDLTSASPFIDLKIVVKNFGRAEDEPLQVSIQHTLPDNSTVQYDSTFEAMLFQDTLIFTIPNSLAYAGTNQFAISIDAGNAIKELREDNNNVNFSVIIPLNGTKNLFPLDFGIVPTTQVQLTFQSANLLDSLRSFVIEIDTTETFTSAWKKQENVEAEVLAKFSVELLSTDSLTYYWRTRLKHPSADENADWNGSSFTYILNGVEGWGQLSFPQYLENSLEGLLLNEPAKRIEFQETSIAVLIKTFGDANTSPATDVSVKINGAEYNLATQGQPCRDNTINLLAFNRINTIPYAAIPFNFQDPRTCGREPQVIVSFTSTEVFNNGINDFIQCINNVAVGDSVVLFTIGNPMVSTWHSDVVNKLSELGISPSQHAALSNGEPFVMYGKKGATSGTALVFTSGIEPKEEQELVVNREITGRNATGTMTSSLIGPAQHWHQLKTKAQATAADVTRINVLGVSVTGSSTLLLEDVATTTDLSTIDAGIYPLLRIEYQPTDELELTPAQLRYWIVEFEPLPEGLLFLDEEPTTKQLQEGETWDSRYGFVNISTQSFADSLVVKYNSINALSNVTDDKTIKIKAPLPGDTTKFQVFLSSINKGGLNDVTVNVNPVLQPELFRDNNVLKLPEAFDVMVDASDPLLSVLVDGRILVNNDFVSSNPAIQITLWDENALIPKTDTVGIRILLQYPCALNCTPTIIYFTRDDVQWTPATTQTPFTVLFSPINLEEGVYTLQIIAEDSRGNKSGETPYSITFEVKNEASTTLSGPYPNPTTGKISFTLTIIGNEVPSGASVEIMNTMGKGMYAGTIPTDTWHIGTNHFTLDFENRLPTGLYLYRIKFADGKVQQGQFVLTD